MWLKLEYELCLLSVSPAAPGQIYPSVRPQIEVVSTERELQRADLDRIRLQPSQPLPEREDDWFVLFDAIREKPVILPAGMYNIMYVCTLSEFTLKH